MITKAVTPNQMLGTIYTIGNLQVAEMISDSGFDWVMIDMEHSTLSVDSIQNSLPVFGNKMLRIVRVPGNDNICIKRVLDTGCDGIIVPMIMNAQEAERVIQSSKYPPDGKRSAGLTRAHGYGRDSNKYLTGANQNVIIMLMIEHIKAVNNLDSILKINGIDAIFIGPGDLSASMGLMGQVEHPKVRAAIDTIKKKCDSVRLPYGIYTAVPEIIKSELRDGCKYMLSGIDIQLFSTAINEYSKELHTLRKSLQL